MTMEHDLEALLGELRGCHEPTLLDRTRVQQALRGRVVRQQLAEPGSEPGEGPRERPGVHLRLLLGSGGSTLVGVMTLAAAAAAAVVTLAHPGSKLNAAFVGHTGALAVTREPVKREPADEGAAEAVWVQPSRTTEPEPEFDDAAKCRAWPCLDAEPGRVGSLETLSLGGVPVEKPDPGAQAVAPPRAAEPDVDDRASGSEGSDDLSLEVTPALALDVAPGRLTPGAGLRVALPMSERRDVALEATVQHFPTAGAGSLLVGGLGLCWRPVRGRLEASLCGRMGYESGSTREATNEQEGERADSAWRVTAGASAELVYNLTRDLGGYVAVQGAMPLATSVGAGQALGMRVMAGPRLRF